MPTAENLEINDNQDLDLEAIESGFEDEDELSVREDDLENIMIFSSDWTVETILSQIAKGNIDLTPRYQRRVAWNTMIMSRFIESILLRFPIPQIVLAESKDDKGKYLVVDGKQRLTALCKFRGLAIDAKAASENDVQFKKLSLSNLNILKDLNGKSLNDFESKGHLAAYARLFDNHTIKTVIVKNWHTDDVLYTIFHRINSGTLPLSPQELRQSIHRGPFLEFAEKFTEENNQFSLMFSSVREGGADPRMRDLEMFVRAFAFQAFYEDYNGSMKAFLDDSTRKLNSSWDRHGRRYTKISNEILNATNFVHDIFDSDWFRKWNPMKKRYEHGFNKSVFDCFVYAFSNKPNYRRLDLKIGIKEAFENLCSSDAHFVRCLERSTNTKAAVNYRIETWLKTMESLQGNQNEAML